MLLLSTAPLLPPLPVKLSSRHPRSVARHSRQAAQLQISQDCGWCNSLRIRIYWLPTLSDVSSVENDQFLVLQIMFGGAGGGGTSKPQQSGGLFGMPAPTDLVSGTLSASTASGFAVKPSFSASSSPPFGSSKSLFGSKTDSASGGSNVFGSLGQKQQSSSSSGKRCRGVQGE